MKYIIKNCPCFIAEYMFFDPCKCEKSNSINGVYQDYCKDIDDCLLKRIVRLCKKEPEKEIINALRKDSQATDWYKVAIGERPNNAYNLALNILNLLEIEVAE